jgi:hypothetical protein
LFFLKKNSGSFLYDFNGQDLLSVSEFDGSPHLLFFFVFFVLVPARFSFLLRLLSLQFQRAGSSSVPESDSSHPLLFFFFSLRGHVQCLFFPPQRTTGFIFEEELLSLDWAFSVSSS